MRIAFFFFVLVIFSCKKEDLIIDQPIQGDYNPTPVKIEVPFWMPPLPQFLGNPNTAEGIELGRMLFYDPILSKDSTIACASCHKQEFAFSDPRRFSEGVRGLPGKRNSMALINLAYNVNGFFWDGRAPTLSAQAIHPIEDPMEMDEQWDKVLAKLARHPIYPRKFREAFGITLASEINREHVTRAITQFERTLISSDSRFDKVVWRNQGWLTDEELRGKQLFFFEENQAVEHPGCSHCHFDPLFTDNSYRNNGLDAVITDQGRAMVTKQTTDLGKFRVTTLRNIALTSPYMHDGRFQTLEEVLDHYSRGGHGLINEDVNIRPFPLSDRDKKDLIAFLETLTDSTFIKNPNFSNPFK
jgi:cytochrome c peroxidase